MNSDMTIPEIVPPGFLTCWNSLANSKTGPDLKSAWTAITERAGAIDPRGLNELWDFYLERLSVFERKENR